MAKRRDRRNRVLQNGETQRSDGRYCYKYTDANGKIRYVYSTRLVASDVTPEGKKEDVPLRDKIKQIKRDLEDGIVPRGESMTVLQLAEKYTAQKTGVKATTEAGYKTVLNILRSDPFGNKKIDKVRLMDAKQWLIDLQKNGRSYSSIHNIRGVLRPAFQLAMDSDYIRKNPFQFPLSTVIYNDSETREALTKEQEARFLDFVKSDPHYSQYYEGIYVLFRTGMRVSEFCGLTKEKLDMYNRLIKVDQQLQRVPNSGYIITSTKTNAGTRILPMTDDVYESFDAILKGRKKLKKEPVVDGQKGFLYLNRNNKPLVGGDWAKIFKGICEKYNSIYREPMPAVSPHICRHTFCSRKAAEGMNPKTLQYWMGHSEIGITFNVYSHVDVEEAKSEIERLSLVSEGGSEL